MPQAAIFQPDPLNPGRVLRADAAIVAHLAQTNQTYNQKEAVGYLVDLLTDLRHWSDANGVEFNEAMVVSHVHYKTECAQRAVGQ